MTWEILAFQFGTKARPNLRTDFRPERITAGIGEIGAFMFPAFLQFFVSFVSAWLQVTLQPPLPFPPSENEGGLRKQNGEIILAFSCLQQILDGYAPGAAFDGAARNIGHS